MNVCKETVRTKSFLKDFESLIKQGLDPNKVDDTIKLLEQHRNNEIPTDHKLYGKQKDLRECHIKGTRFGNNLLLVYKYSNDNLILYLLRLGKHDQVLENKENIMMRFLKEAAEREFGESEDLNLFVEQLRHRFSTFFIVRISGLDSTPSSQEKYFYSQDSAKTYYNKMIDSLIEDDMEDAEISLIKVDLKEDEDELLNHMMYKDFE